MKRVIILFPRLDVMFKEGPVPDHRGPVAPIRLHWARFVELLYHHHDTKHDSVEVIEKPLWQFTRAFVESLEADIIYIPHKSVDTFPLVSSAEIRYYMQTVFPFMFYVDSKGFAGGSSRYPFDIEYTHKTRFYEEMIDRARRGESKFDQPAPLNIYKLPQNFVFFPCQIPHDETIRYHSDVTVLQALIAVLEATKKLNISCVIKGHPVNPRSMDDLIFASRDYNHAQWIDNISIHEVMPKSRAVACVNSGTGMEALLHKVPVITFGRCEYDCVTNKATPSTIETVLTNATFSEEKTKAFFETWYNWCIDTRKIESYSRL